jgi:OOP family OmpA-OmpF porin
MKPAKPILAATVLAGTVFAFPVAHAQKRSNFYLGGALGQSTFKEFCVADPSVLTCDDKDTGWKLFGGYQFNPYFAIEGAYIDWGEVAGTVTPGPRVVPLSQTGMGISVVGSIPLPPAGLSIFGKFGLFRTEQDLPASSIPSREDTETQLGFGAKLALTPSWAARAEWERMTESKVEMLSIGLEYRF